MLYVLGVVVGGRLASVGAHPTVTPRSLFADEGFHSMMSHHRPQDGAYPHTHPTSVSLNKAQRCSETRSRMEQETFANGLKLMQSGKEHEEGCPRANCTDSTISCACLRKKRGSRKKITLLVTEHDLMRFPEVQFTSFLKCSELVKSEYLEYVRFLNETRQDPEYAANRLPDDLIGGVMGLPEFRKKLKEAKVTPRGRKFLEEERERAMNRLQQMRSRNKKRRRQSLAKEGKVGGCMFACVQLTCGTVADDDCCCLGTSSYQHPSTVPSATCGWSVPS